jgi:hypothetical protein
MGVAHSSGSSHRKPKRWIAPASRARPVPGTSPGGVGVNVDLGKPPREGVHQVLHAELAGRVSPAPRGHGFGRRTGTRPGEASRVSPLRRRDEAQVVPEVAEVRLASGHHHARARLEPVGQQVEQQVVRQDVDPERGFEPVRRGLRGRRHLHPRVGQKPCQRRDLPLVEHFSHGLRRRAHLRERAEVARNRADVRVARARGQFSRQPAPGLLSSHDDQQQSFRFVS